MNAIEFVLDFPKLLENIDPEKTKLEEMKTGEVYLGQFNDDRWLKRIFLLFGEQKKLYSEANKREPKSADTYQQGCITWISHFILMSQLQKAKSLDLGSHRYFNVRKDWVVVAREDEDTKEERGITMFSFIS